MYGGKLDSVAAETISVADGDCVRVGALAFNVLHTPGHTKGHVVYVLRGIVSTHCERRAVLNLRQDRAVDYVYS